MVIMVDKMLQTLPKAIILIRNMMLQTLPKAIILMRTKSYKILCYPDIAKHFDKYSSKVAAEVAAPLSQAKKITMVSKES